MDTQNVTEQSLSKHLYDKEYDRFFSEYERATDQVRATVDIPDVIRFLEIEEAFDPLIRLAQLLATCGSGQAYPYRLFSHIIKTLLRHHERKEAICLIVEYADYLSENQDDLWEQLMLDAKEDRPRMTQYYRYLKSNFYKRKWAKEIFKECDFQNPKNYFLWFSRCQFYDNVDNNRSESYSLIEKYIVEPILLNLRDFSTYLQHINTYLNHETIYNHLMIRFLSDQCSNESELLLPHLPESLVWYREILSLNNDISGLKYLEKIPEYRNKNLRTRLLEEATFSWLSRHFRTMSKEKIDEALALMSSRADKNQFFQLCLDDALTHQNTHFIKVLLTKDYQVHHNYKTNQRLKEAIENNEIKGDPDLAYKILLRVISSTMASQRDIAFIKIGLSDFQFTNEQKLVLAERLMVSASRGESLPAVFPDLPWHEVLEKLYQSIQSYKQLVSAKKTSPRLSEIIQCIDCAMALKEYDYCLLALKKIGTSNDKDILIRHRFFNKNDIILNVSIQEKLIKQMRRPPTSSEPDQKASLRQAQYETALSERQFSKAIKLFSEQLEDSTQCTSYDIKELLDYVFGNDTTLSATNRILNTLRFPEYGHYTSDRVKESLISYLGEKLLIFYFKNTKRFLKWFSKSAYEHVFDLVKPCFDSVIRDNDAEAFVKLVCAAPDHIVISQINEDLWYKVKDAKMLKSILDAFYAKFQKALLQGIQSNRIEIIITERLLPALLRNSDVPFSYFERYVDWIETHDYRTSNFYYPLLLDYFDRALEEQQYSIAKKASEGLNKKEGISNHDYKRITEAFETNDPVKLLASHCYIENPIYYHKSYINRFQSLYPLNTLNSFYSAQLVLLNASNATVSEQANALSYVLNLKNIDYQNQAPFLTMQNLINTIRLLQRISRSQLSAAGDRVPFYIKEVISSELHVHADQFLSSNDYVGLLELIDPICELESTQRLYRNFFELLRKNFQKPYPSESDQQIAMLMFYEKLKTLDLLSSRQINYIAFYFFERRNLSGLFKWIDYFIEVKKTEISSWNYSYYSYSNTIKMSESKWMNELINNNELDHAYILFEKIVTYFDKKELGYLVSQIVDQFITLQYFKEATRYIACLPNTSLRALLDKKWKQAVVPDKHFNTLQKIRKMIDRQKANSNVLMGTLITEIRHLLDRVFYQFSKPHTSSNKKNYTLYFPIVNQSHVPGLHSAISEDEKKELVSASLEKYFQSKKLDSLIGSPIFDYLLSIQPLLNDDNAPIKQLYADANLHKHAQRISQPVVPTIDLVYARVEVLVVGFSLAVLEMPNLGNTAGPSIGFFSLGNNTMNPALTAASAQSCVI